MNTNIFEPSKRKFLYMGAAALSSLKLINIGGAAGVKAAPGATEDIESLNKEALRARAYHEVNSLWSKHASYDAAGERSKEIDEIWAQHQPDVSYAENDGMWIGLKDIKQGYCDWFEACKKERLKKIRRLYPDIPHDSKYDLVGWNKMYVNITPLIVVAGDGQTAKGAWDAISYLTDMDKARYIFYRCFVDFIKEDGEWKIWHANSLVCKWNEPIGDDYKSENAKELKEPICDFPSIGLAVPKPKWTKAQVRCLLYDKDKFTGLLTPGFPRYPDPYYTFSETHSYGPDMLETWLKMDQRGPIISSHAAASRGPAAADTLESVDKIAQETLDIQDVQNVWSQHCHMNARGLNSEEIDAIWAQHQTDVAYIESDGMWVGLNAIKRGYCDWFDAIMKERLKKIRRLYPKFEDDPKYAFVGWQKMTTNASPDIVIAGDGKTAKGSWESVGYVTDSDMAMWVYQRYFVDFIKEDGEWKIWHANLLVNMNHDPEKSWADSNGELMEQKKSDYGEPRPTWTRTELRSLPYAKDKLSGILTQNCPRRPEPYYTFSETHSYGPDMLESWARLDAKAKR